MKVGKTTRLRSAPGRSWDMMCMSTIGMGEDPKSESPSAVQVSPTKEKALLGALDY